MLLDSISEGVGEAFRRNNSGIDAGCYRLNLYPHILFRFERISMARKVVVTMVDDYDGESPAEETVVFAIDGVTYEIDLSVLNGSRLRGVFEQWTPDARRVGRVPRGKRGFAGTASDRDQTAAIRDWARKKGLTVSGRGRISAEVVEQYNKENLQPAG
jgi:hypothetical protein